MSVKPNILVTEEVAQQVKALQARKAEVTAKRDEAALRLKTIEQIMQESVMLINKTKEQVTESVDLFLEEWTKIKELYPEVRLEINKKAVEFLNQTAARKK